MGMAPYMFKSWKMHHSIQRRSYCEGMRENFKIPPDSKISDSRESLEVEYRTIYHEETIQWMDGTMHCHVHIFSVNKTDR